MTVHEYDGWRDFIAVVKVKTPRYLKDGKSIEYVEYEVTGDVKGIDHPEIDDRAVWLDGCYMNEHLKDSVLDEIDDELYELAARDEL